MIFLFMFLCTNVSIILAQFPSNFFSRVINLGVILGPLYTRARVENELAISGSLILGFDTTKACEIHFVQFGFYLATFGVVKLSIG